MKKLMITIAATGLLTVPVLSQPGPSPEMQQEMRAAAKERFEAFDVNTDGVVTYDELMVDASNRLAEFDQDQNGILVLDELPLVMPDPPHVEARRMHRSMNERHQGEQDSNRPTIDADKERRASTRIKFMARFDRDHNEQINLEEFAIPLIKMHKRADINGDGEVTSAEFEQSLEQRKHNRDRKMKQDRRR